MGVLVVLSALFDIGLSSKASAHLLRDDRFELGRALLPHAVTGLEHIQAGMRQYVEQSVEHGLLSGCGVAQFARDNISRPTGRATETDRR